MVYFLSYLTVGMILVTLKSPIRRLVDLEVEDLKMHSLISCRDIDAARVVLYRILLSFIIVAIYPVILYRKLEDLYYNFMYGPEPCYEHIAAKVEWLKEEITIEEAEDYSRVGIEGQSLPFGYNNDRWLYLLDIREEGDCLYTFRSPEENWRSFAGIEGVALVRNGSIVTDVVKLLE